MSQEKQKVQIGTTGADGVIYMKFPDGKIKFYKEIEFKRPEWNETYMGEFNSDVMSSAAALKPTDEQTTLSRITDFVKSEKRARYIIEKAKSFGVQGTALIWQFEDMELSKIRRYSEGYEESEVQDARTKEDLQKIVDKEFEYLLAYPQTKNFTVAICEDIPEDAKVSTTMQAINGIEAREGVGACVEPELTLEGAIEKTKAYIDAILENHTVFVRIMPQLQIRENLETANVEYYIRTRFAKFPKESSL